jgi:hypothetical protein
LRLDDEFLKPGAIAKFGRQVGRYRTVENCTPIEKLAA